MFGMGAIAVLFAPLEQKAGQGDPAQIRWIFPVLWLIGTAFFVWYSSRLHQIRTDGNVLYISNHAREIQVPVAQVMTVRENWGWSSPLTATIVFLEPTPFGRTVTFIVKHYWFSHTPTREAQRDLDFLRGRTRDPKPSPVPTRTANQIPVGEEVSIITQSRDRKS